MAKKKPEIKPFGFYLLRTKTGGKQRVAVKRLEGRKVIYCRRLNQAEDLEMSASAFRRALLRGLDGFQPGVDDGLD